MGNQLVNGIWTYDLADVWKGLGECYQDLVRDVKKQYDAEITKIGSIGFSAMMHGYLAFDKDDNLLVPFRTWRNTITEEAASRLTAEFNYNIPQRWSIAHLYQAILNKEEHVKDVAFITTLAGYVHYKLTGEKVLGVGDASGMFPIDIRTCDLDQTMVDKFDQLVSGEGLFLEASQYYAQGSDGGGRLPVFSRKRERPFLIPAESWKREFPCVLQRVMREPEWLQPTAWQSGREMSLREPAYSP